MMLPVALFGAEIGNHPCETNKCVASFGFGFNDAFGFGSSSSGGGTPATYYLLREDGSVMLREDGSKFLREDAP